MEKNRKKPNYWNNYEHCKEEAAKYSSISEFQEHNSAAAMQARKNGWINDFFEYKCAPRGYWNNYDRCRELALECTTRTEFSKRNSAAYHNSIIKGWLDSFYWLVDKRVYNNSKVDCVYVYEFVEFNAVYVGRTLMRRQKKRDYEHRSENTRTTTGTHTLIKMVCLRFLSVTIARFRR